MAKKPDAKSEALPITDPYKVPVTFVNQLAGSGHLNGIVNLTLATAQFTPGEDDVVNADLVIMSRLRMDIVCATSLRDTLTRLIDMMIKVNADAEKAKTEH